MPAEQAKPSPASLAERWHDLADRRLAHFDELYQSGRWRLYYQTEQQFSARMFEVIRSAKIWARLAGREPPTVTVPVVTSSAPAAPATVSLPPMSPSMPHKRDGLRSAA